MNKNEVVQLYLKERLYEEAAFGDYNRNPSFNIATFLVFLEEYILKAKKSYMSTWTADSPPWLMTCKELQEGGTAPVKTYEELVKIFALAGAALEAFTDIDPEQWREEGVKDKWKTP